MKIEESRVTAKKYLSLLGERVSGIEADQKAMSIWHIPAYAMINSAMQIAFPFSYRVHESTQGTYANDLRLPATMVDAAARAGIIVFLKDHQPFDSTLVVMPIFLAAEVGYNAVAHIVYDASSAAINRVRTHRKNNTSS